jgi:hypothetical protein
MKPKKQGKRLLFKKQSIAKLDPAAQRNVKGGVTGKPGKTIADPVTDLSLILVKGCNTNTSCGLYFCDTGGLGTGPIIN